MIRILKSLSVTFSVWIGTGVFASVLFSLFPNSAYDKDICFISMIVGGAIGAFIYNKIVELWIGE